MRALKRVPILPSLLTLGNAFCGFLAMAKVVEAGLALQHDPAGGLVLPAAFNEAMELAALLIFLAMVFDALDGRVARLTRQTSDFGGQLDSLADVVTFGVAPALLAKALIDVHAAPYGEVLPAHPRLYYLATALYVLCAVMRLARFNVETRSHGEAAHHGFAGLPTPAAAAVVASLIAFLSSGGTSSLLLSGRLVSPELRSGVLWAMPWIVALVGVLMVSRLTYPHLVFWILRGRKSFLFLWSAVALLILAALEWQFVLLCCSLGYLLTGPALAVRDGLRRRRPAAAPAHGTDGSAQDEERGEDDR